MDRSKLEITEANVAGRSCCFIGRRDAENILIQPVDEHDLSLLEAEAEHIADMTQGRDFLLAAFKTEDWDGELSLWEAPAVFGDRGFSGGAGKTLQFVTGMLIPYIDEFRDNRQGSHVRYFIGGYSLAGLFSLWAVCETDVFDGAAAASPSVWFPDFTSYIFENEPQAELIYLSLGDKEEKTRNRQMAAVGDNIRAIYGHLKETGKVHTTLEWNEGNHFRDSDKRTAKGFAWVILTAPKDILV